MLRSKAVLTIEGVSNPSNCPTIPLAANLRCGGSTLAED